MKGTVGDYTIRTMTLAELDIAADWAANEGWNPGLYDAGCFYRADPNGFFVGLLGEEPVACISAVAYDAEFGFLGFYIVRPEYRSRGYGMRMWNRAIEYLGTRNIGLDGVVAQQENYKKSGFKLAYRNVRYGGRSVRATPRDRDIVELQRVPFDEVVEYDAKLFPARRPRFLSCWIGLPAGRALGLLRKGRLAGYGVMRRCRVGYKIGPLFADNKEDAETIFLALNTAVENDAPIFLDTPEVNEEAVALARRRGMECVFETARMYTREAPDLDLKKVFGVTSFELG
ncbi:MAG: GNAT family N-acetyltransferase [Chloroflexi bacterium]|nr:GNAT family N-acetyltransferase [Chloroflexota bacterium]